VLRCEFLGERVVGREHAERALGRAVGLGEQVAEAGRVVELLATRQQRGAAGGEQAAEQAAATLSIESDVGHGCLSPISSSM